jgi:hypothetical protein
VEIGEENLKRFFSVTFPLLDERERRLMAAAAVEMLGRGGQARVAEATTMSRNTLITGAAELAGGATRSERIRRPGAGRKKAIDLDPDILVVLDSLVEPESRGDPTSPLRWTLKSTRVLSGELTRLGHQAGSSLVGRMLDYLGYSLQANAKVTGGAHHPDRDGQLERSSPPERLNADARGGGAPRPDANGRHRRPGRPGPRARARRPGKRRRRS